VTFELDDFAWEALAEEAGAMNVPVEELGHFALLYYLADRDSGRIARRLPSREITSGSRAADELRAR
jgi:hypothetical protein